MAELVFVSRSPDATRALGRRLGELCRGGEVLCVDGDLGAGKTVFAQGVAAGLGVETNVTSPTFTLMKEYAGRLPLHHYDAWMEGRERAFLEGGGDDALRGDGVALVEWGSRVAEHLPRPHLRVRLGPDPQAPDDAGRRTVRVALVRVAEGAPAPPGPGGPPALAQRLERLLEALAAGSGADLEVRR